MVRKYFLQRRRGHTANTHKSFLSLLNSRKVISDYSLIVVLEIEKRDGYQSNNGTRVREIGCGITEIKY